MPENERRHFSEAQWRDTLEERKRLGRRLQDIGEEITRLEARIRENEKWGKALEWEEHLARQRLEHLETELREMQADQDFQKAREREAEERRRHMKTVYDPLPRVIDGYLADAWPCPTCSTPADRLRWTHRVDLHFDPRGGEVKTSGWSTDCPQCGSAVQEIVEWVA